jgi:hypothetical protein
MRHNLALASLLLALLAPAFAAPPYQRPAGIAGSTEPLIVAGYRALFTCSAHFFAGRPLDDIKRVELADTQGLGYPDPVIDAPQDRDRQDASGAIVRIAAFRDTMGCTMLPPHWEIGDVPHLPYVQYAPAPDVSRCFPAGIESICPPTA